jgi:hypothetical protein
MRGWIGKRPFFTAGLLACPVIILIAIISAGGGHGNYIAARLLLPFACVAIGEYSAAAWIASILAVIEWPVYGAIVDMAGRRSWAISAVLFVHIGLTVWLFTGGRRGFS